MTERSSSRAPQFRLEHAYRAGLRTGMFDLSASAPASLTARDVLDGPRRDGPALIDLPLDYERGGGSDELRAAVASMYGCGISASGVLITAGASEAIDIVATAVVRNGDRVVVQRPGYDALRDAPALRGAEIVAWCPRAGFEFDFADAAANASGASAVFYNNPHGPSGSIASGTWSGGARLVADEVYRPVDLVPGTRASSVVAFSDRAVSIGDLSKPLGLGGLRVGWIVTRDRDLLQRCADVLDYRSGSISALSSAIAIAALSRFDALLETHVARARLNLSRLAAFVDAHERWLDWSPPQAGYTAFLRLRGGPSPSLHVTLRERGIFALDGAVFDAPDRIRIGFGSDTARFADALAVFGEVLRAHAAPSLPSGSRSNVIVVAKEPRAGFTKTRLAAAVGAGRAAELSDAFLRDTLAFAATRERRLYVSHAPPESAPSFAAIAPAATLVSQPDGDLGVRIGAAFDAAFAAGADRAVLIGSDTPTLPAHLIDVADAALATHDVVLGPADDGGYYLIALRCAHPELFTNIRWGGDSVLAETLDRAREWALRVFVLPYWYDIDDARTLARLDGDPLVRDNTRAALAIRTLEGAVAL